MQLKKPDAPSDQEKEHLRASDWKVINGRLLRRSRLLPHERSVSARHDILPRLANEPKSPISKKRVVGLHRSALPTKVTGWAAQAIEPVAVMAPAGLARTAAARDESPPLSLKSEPPPAVGVLPASACCSPSNYSMPTSPRKTSAPHAIDTPSPPLANGPDVAYGDDYRVYARPSNRSEAIQLTENLERQLEKHASNFRALEQTWSITFCELVRQVYVHCAERGELLDRVRLWFERELKRLGALERKSRERIRGLREATRELENPSMPADGVCSVHV